ncbi:UDP-N-acetylmuramate:L-alanyl-gamma-D-glutamyl-meso-diaminopimelate ligase [Dokdonella fugitiva]|uniref:UDP-N-acetylmuramate:L-alanyl-gamma-D-glutamyl- meso-diaminopimelate ligase n=1 Tax=Dokdonella fugitiva TaxID=328517 RepID=UPI0015F79827|nr:UDP-N-acetylmuramate:L-alanyl-gamma-D-glutamyl-meso-diaminopimelate ligase [Dokdonella fugitiva]MBA8882227.1 UDP-N-acetylmuramate: L-alanyl-gamma-D-glutamyl-meso-diaminopimelate ligase [Dokdonella fugitiva]
MKLHILGICGTFMGGIAALARELGHEVEGSDANVYPPMSTQLERLGIALKQGFAAENLMPPPDLVVVGNAMTRGNAAIEYMLDERLRYVSGPQWLGETVLAGRRVLAVAGTHGKTTTTSLLAWILECAGRAPGFLVGGVPANFGVSARLGGKPSLTPPSASADGSPLSRFAGEGRSPTPAAADFIIEADEYDTAFFDKRSKFVHYRPTIAILNNLEYDHADIFPDVAAIQRQFHHLVRTVPRSGRLVVNAEDARLAEVLAMGCWTPVETFGIDAGDWRARLTAADGSSFVVAHAGRELGEASWSLGGRHNVMNALAAIAAAHAAGVEAATAIAALATFRNVARRMELVAEHAGIHVYDDFAHHPTAIATTLAGLRAKVGAARILVGMEPRSNSMRMGAHADDLAPSLADADAVVFLKRPELPWDAGRIVDALGGRGRIVASVDALVADLLAQARAGDHVVFMSNGGFENAPRRFASALVQRR